MRGFDQVIDLSDPRERMNLINNIRSREGLHRVEIKRHRKTRTTQQNRYLWGVVYPAFVDFRQSQGEDFETDDAHEFFKLKFLRKPVVNVETGEVLGQRTISTTTLNTEEMGVYIDKICAWLAGYDIPVPPADRSIAA